MPQVISFMKRWPQSLARVVSEIEPQRNTDNTDQNSRHFSDLCLSVNSVAQSSKIVAALELASIKTRYDRPASIYFYRINSQKICVTNQF